MAKRKSKKRRHVPQRTCVACRTVLPKRELIRIVRTSEGVFVDTTGKKNGRGAYLHNQMSCWDRGLKSTLSSALKTTFTEEDLERLHTFKATIPEEVPNEESSA